MGIQLQKVQIGHPRDRAPITWQRGARRANHDREVLIDIIIIIVINIIIISIVIIISIIIIIIIIIIHTV